MSVRISRVVLAAVCLMWLAGCETTSTNNPLAKARDAEAWLGLAAAYDRLKRFDLADRAYTQAVRLIGPTPDIMNNQGFSYLLRGDYGRARSMLLAAQAKDPKSPYIANNIRLLEESAHKAKGIN